MFPSQILCIFEKMYQRDQLRANSSKYIEKKIHLNVRNGLCTEENFNNSIFVTISPFADTFSLHIEHKNDCFFCVKCKHNTPVVMCHTGYVFAVN